MRVRSVISLTLWFLLLLTPVSAQTILCVNGSTGNDALTIAQVRAGQGCWRSLGRAVWGSTNRSAPNAAEAARAGDVVTVEVGTYTTAGTNIRYDPAYNPANSGSSSAGPITFKANGLVHLTLSSNQGPVVGCLNRSHVVWDGFSIDEAQAAPNPDTGSVVAWGSNSCVFQNLTIKGIYANWQDNHTGIRVEASNDTVIRNNRISDIGSSPQTRGQNDAGVMLYDSNRTIIEHNEIWNVGSGVFIKGQHPGFTQSGTIIRYNKLHHNAFGIIQGPATQNGRTYGNIITDSVFGLNIYCLGTGETERGVNETFANNTIYNTQYAVWFRGNCGAVTSKVWNNAVSTTQYFVTWGENITSPVGVSFEHNAYFSHPTFSEFSGVRRTFAEWKTAFGVDGAAPASVEVNPQFVNAAGGDFHLAAGSPARTLGVDVLDLDGDGNTTEVIPAGAYVTGQETIGPTSGEQPAPCIFTLSATSGTVPAEGGSGNVTVTTGPPLCSPSTWTASSAETWVTITTTSAAATYTAQTNSSTARSAVLTIAGQAFTLSQAGAPVQTCTFTIAPTSTSVAATGGTGSVTVTASAQTCAWSVSNPASWITPSVTSGTGSGSVGYAVAGNTNATRAASLIIAGQPFTISQAGAATSNCVDGTKTVAPDEVVVEQLSDGNSTQRQVIAARVRALQLAGFRVEMTSKSTYTTLWSTCVAR